MWHWRHVLIKRLEMNHFPFLTRFGSEGKETIRFHDADVSRIATPADIKQVKDLVAVEKAAGINIWSRVY